MEVSGKLYAPDILDSEKKPPVPIKMNAAQVVKPVWPSW
jgi:hypothetical protein